MNNNTEIFELAIGLVALWFIEKIEFKTEGNNRELHIRAPLKTLLWLLTCSLFQLVRCRNTHLAQLNSVFSASYLKKNNFLIIPNRVIRDAHKYKRHKRT